MLLVIDVGNTNTVIGVYDDKHLVQNWRIRTERRTTEDEFNILARNLFSEGNINSRNIHKTIISCVVPPMVTILDSFCRKYLGHTPHLGGCQVRSKTADTIQKPIRSRSRQDR